MKFSLVKNWRDVLTWSWAWRINIATALLTSIYAGVEFYQSGQAPLLPIAVALGSFGAAIARIVAQSNLAQPSVEDYAKLAGAYAALLERIEGLELVKAEAQSDEILSPASLRTMAAEGGAIHG
jgi:type IV secretory pathway TrbF-like protein